MEQLDKIPLIKSIIYLDILETISTLIITLIIWILSINHFFRFLIGILFFFIGIFFIYFSKKSKNNKSVKIY